MQLWICRVKKLTKGSKRYILYIPKKRYTQRNLYIYHCGDVSGEVPPVLIPNTEVKLTSAENTWLATVREDRLLLHPITDFTVCSKIPHCPLAQQVEHSAVNRSVVSSSLSGAAIKRKHQPFGWCFSFAVGHPTEMNYPSNISYCVVDAHTQINLLLSPSPSRQASQSRTSLSGAAKK